MSLAARLAMDVSLVAPARAPGAGAAPTSARGAGAGVPPTPVRIPEVRASLPPLRGCELHTALTPIRDAGAGAAPPAARRPVASAILPPTRDPEAGFTLIEALVAMAVLAVGAVSLLTAAEAQTTRVRQIMDRSAARWVAEYRLAELRLGLAAAPGPVSMMGAEWIVDVQASATPDPDLRQVTVRVAPEGGPVEGRTLAVLDGYLDGGSAGGSAGGDAAAAVEGGTP